MDPEYYLESEYRFSMLCKIAHATNNVNDFTFFFALICYNTIGVD